MEDIVQSFVGALSGGVMAALLGVGVLLTFRHRFFQIRGLPFIWRNTVGSLLKRDKSSRKGISPFQAVTTALAGTMGVGNIAGVATAILAGGPGAIFWMWISAFFGMMTKYAEIFLAVRFRRAAPEGGYHGGPMYYIQDGMGRRGLACTFAALCALCALGIGNLTQVNSVSSAMAGTFGIPTWATGAAVAVLVGLVVFGGVRRIAAVTELVIPFISAVYLGCAGVFLWIHRAYLGDAFRLIFAGAFGLRQAAGGALGYGFTRAMSMGLARGVFTNEAGLGSAPIVHAAADCRSPAHQGVWGIFEVFLDTLVVCTVTALVILCAGGGRLWQSGLDGALLTSAAFESAFAGFGARFVSVSILFFAVPSMLGWCYYGERALGFLTGGNQRATLLYRAVFLLCILPGAMGGLKLVWALSDALNALMALPNIIAILALRRVVDIRWSAANGRTRTKGGITKDSPP